MIRLLFPAMHVSMASDRMALVYGVATGGTTTLATGNALRCDEALLRIGIDLGREFEALYAELPISTGHERRWRPVTRELFAACEELGLDPTVTPKLVDYSRCTRCGRCVLGCPTGAKWDSRDHLRQAVARGARLLTGAKVERLVLDESGNGRGPRDRSGRAARKAHASFSAPIWSCSRPAASGPRRSWGGRACRREDRLFVDPVLCVAAPAAGVPRGRRGADALLRRGRRLHHLALLRLPELLLRPLVEAPAARHREPDDQARRQRDRLGQPRQKVSKGLTPDDKQRLAAATESCTEILARFGARRDSIFLGMLNAGHPGGMLPLTGGNGTSCIATGCPTNVYVADASLLPQSLGKPPMLTIMALAKRVGGLCAERCA